MNFEQRHTEVRIHLKYWLDLIERVYKMCFRRLIEIVFPGAITCDALQRFRQPMHYSLCRMLLYFSIIRILLME